jgi:hypothetical protein
VHPLVLFRLRDAHAEQQNGVPAMTNQELKEMKRLGITSETKTIFHFQGSKYDRLLDAIAYARIVFEAQSKSDTK